VPAVPQARHPGNPLFFGGSGQHGPPRLAAAAARLSGQNDAHRAASLYGWDILLRGTFWPGPDIGVKARQMIRSASEDGHEIGLHAWDHHGWQAHIEAMDAGAIRDVLRRGYDRLGDITGTPPACSAVPAWKCTPTVLEEKSRLPFVYNSDCRGRRLFYPVVDGRTLTSPRFPSPCRPMTKPSGSTGSRRKPSTTTSSP
jgi:peptidoglycan/xylan/chitin deacetylase (PgdA/CDA1 family)